MPRSEEQKKKRNEKERQIRKIQREARLKENKLMGKMNEREPPSEVLQERMEAYGKPLSFAQMYMGDPPHGRSAYHHYLSRLQNKPYSREN